MTRLNAEQLQTMQDGSENILLINTLDPKHYSSTQIPGSVNVPQSRDDFVQQVENKAQSKDQTIVVYCASEQCDSSLQAARKLEDAGFTSVYDFEAGAKGWKEAGQALATA